MAQAEIFAQFRRKADATRSRNKLRAGGIIAGLRGETGCWTLFGYVPTGSTRDAMERRAIECAQVAA